MSLTQILKEIETNRPNAEAEVKTEPATTYGGRVGLKRAATEAMKRLKVDYRNQLMESTVFIVVTGSSREDFTTLASNDSFECFANDPEEFYKDLVSRMSPALFGRENTRNLFNVASSVFYDKALELDIMGHLPMKFSDKYNTGVSKPSEFVPVIRDIINDQVGSEIVGVNAVHSILDKAIKRGHTAEVTPIILNTGDEKFALDLYKGLPEMVRRGTLNLAQVEAKKRVKAFLVIAGKSTKTLKSVDGAVLVKTVTEDSVKEALTAIRSRVL